MVPIISLNGTPDDCGWVMATMLFPNDEALRNQFFAIELMRKATLDVPEDEMFKVDAKTLRLLMEAPAYDDLKKLTAESTKEGIVAGDIMGMLYVMDFFKFDEPSINKAIHVSKEYGKKSHFGDGSAIDISERKIREHWEKFKPVAHFWGAWRLNKAYPYAQQKDLLSGSLSIFLQVAAGLAEFGCNFIPKRSQVPILDQDKIWELPAEIAGIKLKQDAEYPDRLKDFLKKYKAPKAQY